MRLNNKAREINRAADSKLLCTTLRHFILLFKGEKKKRKNIINTKKHYNDIQRFNFCHMHEDEKYIVGMDQTLRIIIFIKFDQSDSYTGCLSYNELFTKNIQYNAQLFSYDNNFSLFYCFKKKCSK